MKDAVRTEKREFAEELHNFERFLNVRCLNEKTAEAEFHSSGDKFS